jgi:hypothetical protein
MREKKAVSTVKTNERTNTTRGRLAPTLLSLSTSYEKKYLKHGSKHLLPVQNYYFLENKNYF